MIGVCGGVGRGCRWLWGAAAAGAITERGGAEAGWDRAVRMRRESLLRSLPAIGAAPLPQGGRPQEPPRLSVSRGWAVLREQNGVPAAGIASKSVQVRYSGSRGLPCDRPKVIV